MDSKNSNTFLAIALSIMVLLGWQLFYAAPLVENERRSAELQAQREAVESGEKAPEDNGVIPKGDTPIAAQTGSGTVKKNLDREEALAQDSRVTLNTEVLHGSINLRGARIDDLKLKNYHETIDPTSPEIELLAPRGTANAYFAEFGYVAGTNAGTVPGPDTLWTSSNRNLSANGSVQLEWTNEKGVRFERTIELDDKYMFTVSDKVSNTSGEVVEVTPYGRIARFGRPDTQGIFVLHEGLIGFLGEEGLQEIDYGDLEDDKEARFEKAEAGWLGITDKYWATALIPGTAFKSRFAYFDDQKDLFQADFLGTTMSVAAGQNSDVQHRLFAGAKKTELIDGYDNDLNLLNFDLMIDWGWFYFITKPLFWLIHYLFGIVGNFGVAILMATVVVKALFFYFANLSYASMAKMKKVQPEMTAIRERFPDDKQKQQQEVMALYKKEKINPAAGCLPILIQIPVFFALYKVLFVTIEMRHAPFFGWIQDLAAPDPTSMFNLFGLLPYDVPGFLLIGVWPLIMGITMFLQMQMNPAPPDPTQAMIFKWMPVVFTFMLATFPAGLVIYWAWNNTLSIIQQGFIMRKHGAKIELLGNLKGMLSRKKETPE